MMRSLVLALVVLAFVACIVSYPCGAQNAPSTDRSANSQTTVQSIDGAAGPCAVTLTVTADSKPVVAADVKVHIEYGFAGIRRLDLEAYTGNDGRVKFTGLPARVHRPPLQFKASKDSLAGMAVFNPEAECNAEHEIVLTRKAQDQN